MISQEQDDGTNDIMLENTAAPRSPRKISIVLPPEDELQSTSRRRNPSHQEDSPRRLSDAISLSSYVIHHSRKSGGGQITPQFWNDLAPYLSPKSKSNPRATPNGWSIGGTTRTITDRFSQPWNALVEEEGVPMKEKMRLPRMRAGSDYESESRSRSRMRSCTATPTLSNKSYDSARRGSTSLTPLPIVRFRRPQVAIKKGIINYADVQTLRHQVESAQAERRSAKFRRDYARTTNDIYRMKLNKTDNLDWKRELQFRETCATYLGTSPGASRAVAGQLCYL